MSLIIRDEDPVGSVDFWPTDPDPLLFSFDPDPDPSCNNGFTKLLSSEQNITQNHQIQA